MFTLELLQAVSDWQREGDTRTKRAHGQALKAEASALPQKFRQVGSTCFRRIALDSRYIWQLGTQLCLKETLSSWTDSLDVANVVSRKQAELFSLGFAHSWTSAAGFDALQSLPTATQLFHD